MQYASFETLRGIGLNNQSAARLAMLDGGATAQAVRIAAIMFSHSGRSRPKKSAS